MVSLNVTMSLTPSQQQAKDRVEATGGKFVPPYQYKKVKKSSLAATPSAVASYSARKSYPDKFAALSPITEQLVDQILDPESSNDLQRWPNTYGLSATYKSKNVINASFATDNRSMVMVHPRLRNAIYTTFGFTHSADIPAQAAGPRPFSVQNISAGHTQVVPWVAPINYLSRHVAFPVPNSNTNRLLHIFPFVNKGDSGLVNLIINFPNAVSNQIAVSARLYGPTYGLSTTLVANTIDNVVTLPIYQSLPTGAATYQNVSWFSLDVTILGVPWVGVASMSVTSFSAGALGRYTLPNLSQHTIASDIRDTETLIGNAERCMISSQSLLCTANMPSVNDGGVIAIARVPGGTNVGAANGINDQNNYYEWLASLPYNSYNGPTKHGAYSFYIPDDERGFFYRDVAAFFDAELPYLAAEFTCSDVTTGSIVRIQVTTIVQFTTNASIYSMAPSPVISEYRQMHHILSCIQASYSNDGHKAGLKKHLKTVGKQVLKVLKNPKTYTTAASLAALLL